MLNRTCIPLSAFMATIVCGNVPNWPSVPTLQPSALSVMLSPWPYLRAMHSVPFQEHRASFQHAPPVLFAGACSAHAAMTSAVGLSPFCTSQPVNVAFLPNTLMPLPGNNCSDSPSTVMPSPTSSNPVLSRRGREREQKEREELFFGVVGKGTVAKRAGDVDLSMVIQWERPDALIIDSSLSWKTGETCAHAPKTKRWNVVYDGAVRTRDVGVSIDLLTGEHYSGHKRGIRVRLPPTLPPDVHGRRDWRELFRYQKDSLPLPRTLSEGNRGAWAG